MPIKRVWHGWTTPENADRYQELLTNEVIPGIAAKRIPGYRGIEVLRREIENEFQGELGAEVEFVTLMTFDSIECVIAFQGVDYKRCYVPDAAKRVLSRWDEFALHFEVEATLEY